MKPRFSARNTSRCASYPPRFRGGLIEAWTVNDGPSGSLVAIRPVFGAASLKHADDDVPQRGRRVLSAPFFGAASLKHLVAAVKDASRRALSAPFSGRPH